MKDPAFLFYTKDFQSGTQDMSCEEIGAYLRLLMYQHQHGHIPNDTERMMRITGIFSVEKWQMVWQMVKHKFNQKDNHLVNERLSKESFERATAKPKKIAAACLAGLISSDKQLDSKQKYDLKKSFTITDFIELEEEEMKLQIRDWFYEMVNQMVNNLADGDVNGDADADANENKGKEGSGEKPKYDLEAVVKIFNSVCHMLPSVSKLTPQRSTALKNRINEVGLNGLGDVFQKVSNSRFLNGESDRGWKADFDWILKPANFIKISEGRYDNVNNGKQKSTSEQFAEAFNSDAAKNFRFSP